MNQENLIERLLTENKCLSATVERQHQTIDRLNAKIDLYIGAYGRTKLKLVRLRTKIKTQKEITKNEPKKAITKAN